MADDAKEQARKREDPSTTSPAYEVMSPRWGLIDALLGGTETMRAAGERYLPKHQAEEEVGYADRLAGAVLYNMTEHTLESLVGKPFRDEPVVSDDTPPAVQALLGDVDLQGNGLGVFCRDWFRTGLAKGFGGVLVDFPRKDETIATKEDQSRAGLRPYWVAVSPESILDLRTVTENGVERLSHVRILETYTEPDGFAAVVKQRIRVLEPGTVQFYEQEIKDKKIIWVPGETFAVDLPVIPLVIWYSTSRVAPLLCKPRLLDLAELNRCHWQSTSDQRHILTVCRFPILACSGASGPTATAGSAANGEEDIVIGPNKVVYIGEPAGRLYYVEHSGAAIAAGRADLQDMERQMASYGAQFLTEKPGTQTATATAIDSAESTSELAAIAKTFEDSVAQVFALTARWLDIPEGTPTGTITLDDAWSQQKPVGGAIPPAKGQPESEATTEDGPQGTPPLPPENAPGGEET